MGSMVLIAGSPSGSPGKGDELPILVDSAGRFIVATPSGATANEAQGNIASGAADGSTKPVKVGGVYNSTTPTVTTGQRVDLQTDNRGKLHTAPLAVVTTPADAVGNAMQTFAGVDSGGTQQTLVGAQRTWLFNGATWDRLVKANAASRLLSSANTTNGTSVKASAGNVFRIRGNNTVASKRYFKLYNKASAPTVGTDTPVLTFLILASAEFVIDVGGSYGHYFSTGIAYAITGAAADNDTTAIGTGDIECLNLTYS